MSTTLTRRSLVAAAPAAVVAATLPAIAFAGLDAELLALREPYERTMAGLAAAGPVHNRAEEAYIAAKQAHPELDERALRKASGLIIAERAWNRAVGANTEMLLRITETPARTLEGLRFKAQACRRADFDSELAISIAEDLLAMGEHHA